MKRQHSLSRGLASTFLFVVALSMFGGVLLTTGCRSVGLGDAQPAVYRFVLDGRPRVAAIPLDDEMWVAYDATHGALIRVWKGGVAFEGSVYSGKHGPQPRIVGKDYAVGATDVRVWQLQANGADVASEMIYRGYSVAGDRVTLHYALRLATGREVTIDESPRFRERRDRRVLEREFAVGGMEFGESVTLVTLGELGQAKTTVSFTADGDNVLVHSFAADVVADAEIAPPLTFPSTDLLLPSETLAGADSGPAEVVLEIPPTTVAPKIDAVADSCWSGAPERRIGKKVAGEIDNEADCSGTYRVMHDVDNLYVFFNVQDDKIVNDSALPFHDDAVEVYIDGGYERNAFYDENDAQYIFGCGDTQFWVNTSPLQHPGVEFATKTTATGYDVEVKLPWANVGVSPTPGQLIGFEVHIDEDDVGLEYDAALSWFSAATDTWSDSSKMATVQLGGSTAVVLEEAGDREPGISMRAYQVGRSLGQLHRLVPGQTPNVNKVINTIDLSTVQDFGGLSERFLAELTGYIACDITGPYKFRLTADDGARLWIDNRPVADVSEVGTSNGELELGAGEHRLLLRYFQDGGPRQLRLEWQRPGETAFSVIPAGELRCRVGGVRVTSPGVKRVLEPRLRLTPGDGVPLVDVHPSYTLTPARPEGFRPRVGGIDFLPDGRMLVCSWDPRGDVWVLDGHTTGNPNRIWAKRIATGLAEPLGLAVHDGRVFVLQKQELTELIDHDGDDVIDEYRCIANGWGVTPNFHEFAFGLVHDGEAFWATLATAIEPGGASSSPQDPDRGRAIRITLDGKYTFAAAGFRTPNGVGLGPDGMVLVTDNQGDWLPSSKLVHARAGAFYGNRSVDPDGTADLEDTPPIVWLPQGEIGNSPSQPLLLRDGPYAGQIVHGDVTHGGLKRTCLDIVDGVVQGAVFRFSQGLEAGVNRIAYGPDGAIYVGGIGSTGNWGQDRKLRYGLQRLNYNELPVFEMLSARVLANGVELEFTEPLAVGLGWDPIDYELHDWTYRPTREYGGPKIDERVLQVLSASVSEDRMRVFLEVPGMQPQRCVYVHLGGAFVSDVGSSLWTTESWMTINKIPTDARGTVLPNPHRVTPNQLTAEETAQGFRLLFDGSSLTGFRGYGQQTVPLGWSVVDGELRFDPSVGDGGDLMTVAKFDDFELRFEWAVADGGNSGIFYRVDETAGPPWATGPEYQILDDARHPDGRRRVTSAAACYALYPPSAHVARSAGLFNRARIVVRGKQIEHWLNGVRVVQATIGSADWRDRFANSKFVDFDRFARETEGAIVLQDHGDPVRYRSLRIRRL
ncbi:MAG: family 16 glycoside hydrolase [Planctomycetota bacterium]